MAHVENLPADTARVFESTQPVWSELAALETQVVGERLVVSRFVLAVWVGV